MHLYLYLNFYKLNKVSISKFIEADKDFLYEEISSFKNYQEFIPGCSKSELIEKNKDFEIGVLQFIFLKKDYSIKSKNILLDSEIHIEQLEGPFNYFLGKWRFYQKDDDITKVSFEGEFELPFILEAIVNKKVIELFSENMLHAFINYINNKS